MSVEPIDGRERAGVALLQQGARERNVNYASTRHFAPDKDLKGVAGEYALGRDFRLPVDFRRQPKGDGGWDNWMPLLTGIKSKPIHWVMVDVKCSEITKHLLVEVSKCKADIYILALFKPNDLLRAELLRWAWRAEVMAAPIGDPHHRGMTNYVVPFDKLQPMAWLHEVNGSPFKTRMSGGSYG